MSKKNKDDKNRWRNITIAFRVSQGENDQINRMVKLSGLTKQEYLTSNMLKQSFTVKGNPKVYKGLKDTMMSLIEELKRINDASEVDSELMEVIKTAMAIYEGMKEE